MLASAPVPIRLASVSVPSPLPVPWRIPLRLLPPPVLSAALVSLADLLAAVSRPPAIGKTFPLLRPGPRPRRDQTLIIRVRRAPPPLPLRGALLQSPRSPGICLVVLPVLSRVPPLLVVFLPSRRPNPYATYRANRGPLRQHVFLVRTPPWHLCPPPLRLAV